MVRTGLERRLRPGLAYRGSLYPAAGARMSPEARDGPSEARVRQAPGLLPQKAPACSRPSQGSPDFEISLEPNRFQSEYEGAGGTRRPVSTDAAFVDCAG